MKQILTVIFLLLSLTGMAQVQTIGNRNNTVTANGKLNADSGTYSKGIITLTRADSSYIISIINTHAGTGSVTGKGKTNRIVVLIDTATIASSNLLDSANYFTVLDTAVFKGKVKLNYVKTETLQGDSTLVWAKDSTIRKTAPHPHVIKVSYPTPVYSNASVTGDTASITPPTTIAGYGITDAYTKTNMQTSGQAALHWGNITSSPTTIAGYGITDAYTKTNMQTSGQAALHWGNITNTPTTRAGYGINTDAMGYTDTTAMLSKYLRGVYLTAPSIFGTPTYALGNYVDTIKVPLVSQSARTVFCVAGSTAVPSFQTISSAWISDAASANWGAASIGAVGINMSSITANQAVVMDASGFWKNKAIANSVSGRTGDIVLYQADITDSLIVLTDGATVTFDLSKSRQAVDTLTGSGHTLAFTNLPTGNRTIVCRLRLVQDATGGRSFNPPSGTLVANGMATPYLNTNANGVTDWVILYEAKTGIYYIKSCTF